MLAHLFSVLPKMGLDEAMVPEALLAELATRIARAGAMVEINERWACPSPRTVDVLARAGVTVVAGSAEATGLPDECADIVTASQAMHWFDAERALPEVIRILRPGGIFAAYDYDWPPCIDWETDEVFGNFDRRTTELETERGLRPPHAGKQHLERIEGSGLFRYAREIALHSRDTGDEARIVSLAMTQGGAAALLAAGATEDEIGLAALREVAARRVAAPRTWWWTYRVRLAVR